jgi:magnesium-transporting ATPase (P-type)
LLLWAAAGLSWLAGTPTLGIAIIGVIFLNAGFAFIQERHAARTVEAMGKYLPTQATVRRDGHRQLIAARDLVVGDVLVVNEGDRISADARLLTGDLEVDVSALTGESQAVYRSAELAGRAGALVESENLVFSGTSCTGGDAETVVFATGMRTELGRIAAMSAADEPSASPLERQVRKVAWLIAAVAIGVGLAFLPLGTLAAGLPFTSAAVFSVGLLVANVPEGLLPTITLALAVGVRSLARRGAVVKRLSAVETLGSTTVICTDKTGTLTENRMQATDVWTVGTVLALGDAAPSDSAAADGAAADVAVDVALGALARAVTLCDNAELGSRPADQPLGDPTEIALLRWAQSRGEDISPARRDHVRREQFHFDPRSKLMSTLDAEANDSQAGWVHTKGAPESVLAICTSVRLPDGGDRPLEDAERSSILQVVDGYAVRGLRVLAAAEREWHGPVPRRNDRETVERDLCFLGLVAMRDPARAEVPDAVRACKTAGIRIIMITGDHERTADAIARQIGIVGDEAKVVGGGDLNQMDDPALDQLLRSAPEIVFARCAPEAKLRIANALQAQGEIVAMTGDGVNDAPALHRADIGIAMGRSGTDVAREAATMVLLDDNFASIAAAIEEGRRVYANVKKFIFYIFVHLTPEVAPFLLFAISGGRIPLPLTVLQILAIDLGTETLPALALGREPAEPGLMLEPPRPRSEGIIQRGMLVRAWLFLGVISAALALFGFFAVLQHAGWRPGDAVGAGSRLHHAYQQATTMTFLGIVACQVGAAFAARTDRVSLRTVGVFTNRLLLWGIAFEVTFAIALTYVPPLQGLFGTAALPPQMLLIVLPFPFVIWGADEFRRAVIRRRHPTPPELPGAEPRSAHRGDQAEYLHARPIG